MANPVLVFNIFFLIDIASFIGTVISASKKDKKATILCGVCTIIMIYLTFIV